METGIVASTRANVASGVGRIILPKASSIKQIEHIERKPVPTVNAAPITDTIAQPKINAGTPRLSFDGSFTITTIKLASIQITPARASDGRI